MESVYIGLFFIFGVIIGSFYNVVGLRLPVGESIMFPGSHCPVCKKELRPWELIPVASYFLLNGKCRTCETKISPIYPTIELISGLLFAYSFYRYQWSLELIAVLLLLSLLIIITVSDIKYMLIPNKILLFFSFVFLLVHWINPLTTWSDSIFGAVIGFFLLFLISFISKGGMGGGDIKLFALLGFIMGVKSVLFIFFFSSLFGSLFGLFMMAIGKLKRKTAIPFGPFIALGTVFTLFFSDAIFQWYLNLL